jgi:hypothetical protein
MTSQLFAIDFNSDIARLTKNFTGRQWVFDEIDCWLRESEKRFFILTIKLIVKLPPQILLKALEGVQESKDTSYKINLLTALVDKLTPNLLPQALKVAQSIQNEFKRAQVYSAIAIRFPQVLPEALVSAQLIQNINERAHQLVTLTQKFPGCLPTALEAVQSIQNENDRHNELTALSKCLLNDLDRFKHWTNLLHFFANRARSSLLNDIAALATVLVALGDDDEDAALEVSRAVEDVSRWWP